MVKTCTKCGEDKALELFTKCKRNKSGRTSLCKKCTSERIKSGNSYRNRDAAPKKAWREQSRKEFKAFVDSVRISLGCCCCGAKSSIPDMFEFHHIDSDSKKHGIASMGGHSKNKLLAEIVKCCVLCSNCHKTLHYHEREGNPQYGEMCKKLKHIVVTC